MIKVAFLEERAAEAQRCAHMQDWRGTFGIVRSFSGTSTAAVPSPVLNKEGVHTSSEEERQMRWLEHFQEVFKGARVTTADLQALPHDPPLPGDLSMTAADTAAAWRQLGSNKGVGRDGLPAEFWQATAAVTAPIAASLYNEVLQSEVWPVAWTGGRLQEIFKLKGHRANCDDYRGIILEDHLGRPKTTFIAACSSPVCGSPTGCSTWGRGWPKHGLRVALGRRDLSICRADLHVRVHHVSRSRESL